MRKEDDSTAEMLEEAEFSMLERSIEWAEDDPPEAARLAGVAEGLGIAATVLRGGERYELTVRLAELDASANCG